MEDCPARDECPNCGYLSYANGYCHECGEYRKPDKDEWRVERHPDLVDMMNTDEALGFGFSMVGENE